MSFPAPSRRTLFGGLLAGAVGFFTRAKAEAAPPAPAAVPEPAKRVPRGFGTTLYMHFDSDRVLKFEPSISTSGLTCGELKPTRTSPAKPARLPGSRKPRAAQG